MRCPSCNKFATQTIDQDEPEVDLSVDEAGNVTGTVRIVVHSECCGDELKEANFDVDVQYDGDEHILAEHTGEGHDLEVEVTNIEATDDYQRTDRRGKPIRNPRYMKHLYGYTLSAKVTCSCKEGEDAVELFTFDTQDDIAAGSMDELI